ncbi:acyl carrier protein [Streptomyces sp. Ac-502]|uniref:acyl carrier protein n=1 Tax=Streptomyces sp. Ac-502 TaxID=3342801 RepID=UPI0038626CB7
MNSLDDFVTLIRDDLGLDVDMTDVDRPLDQVAGWDSLHLIALLTRLEHSTGHSLSLPAALEASSLRGLYDVAVTG